MTRSDIIIIILVFLIAIGGFYINKNTKKMPGEILVIRSFSKEIKKIKLPAKRSVEFEYESKKWALEIDGSNVRVARCDCPRKYCKNKGWIKGSSMVLICVPLGFQAQIIGDNTVEDIDVVTR